MNIHELEVFVHAYESGSFAAAAEALFITRQAASKTVGQLEGELGTLFVRNARGLDPTELARKIFPVAQRMLGDRDQILADARSNAAGQLGSLALALEPGTMLTLPPRLVELYREARPQITLTTELLPTPVGRRHLLDGRADAVVSGPLAIEGVAYEPLFASNLVIVFSVNHLTELALAQGVPTSRGALVLPLEALAHTVILGVDPENSVEQALLPYLASRNLAVELTCDYGDSMLGQSEMLRGTGGVIVEERAAWIQFDRPNLALVPLCGEDAPRWLAGINYLPTSKHAATVRDFAAFAADQVAQQALEGQAATGADQL